MEKLIEQLEKENEELKTKLAIVEKEVAELKKENEAMENEIQGYMEQEAGESW